VFAHPARTARTHRSQRERSRPAAPFHRDVAHAAARIVDAGFDLRIFYRAKRNAPTLDEGERVTDKIPGEPGTDRGGETRPPGGERRHERMLIRLPDGQLRRCRGWRIDRRNLGEAQLIGIVGIHFGQDAVARAEVSFEHLLGKFVLDFALNGAA